MNYYLDLEQQIERLLNEGNTKEALRLIEDELKMPYIPMKTEEKLKEWQQECQKQLNIPIQPAIDFEMIQEFLLDEDEMLNQAGLIELSKLNLRQHLNELQLILSKSNSSMVKSMILLNCVDQQIDTEFRFEKDGMIYEVNPRYIVHPKDSEGYQLASTHLEEITFKEPSLNDLVQQLLVHEVILALPQSYDELEAKPLANSILKKGYVLLNRESEWYNYTVENKIKESDCLDLISTL